jgi:hypothetical protein
MTCSLQLRPRRAQQHGSLVFLSSPPDRPRPTGKTTTCTRPSRNSDRSSNERSPTDRPASASSLSEEEESNPLPASCPRLLTARDNICFTPYSYLTCARHRTGSSLASKGYQPNPPYEDDGDRNVGGEDRLASKSKGHQPNPHNIVEIQLLVASWYVLHRGPRGRTRHSVPPRLFFHGQIGHLLPSRLAALLLNMAMIISTPAKQIVASSLGVLGDFSTLSC